MRALLLAGVVALGWTGAAKAAVITFGGYGPGNLPVTTYSEAGFTVTRLSGQLDTTSGNGNPPPSIFATNGASFSVTDGGIFDLLSFQGGDGSFTGSAGYTVTGFLAGTQIYSDTFSASSVSFQTFNLPSSTSVDDVRFDLTGSGANVDNIVVNAVIPTTVPEPATLALLALPLGLVGLVTWKQRNGVAAV